MQQLERDIERCLSVVRELVRKRGFTQVEVQEALGWGRSYVSQIFTKQKKIRLEQLLLILDVIGVKPADFFARVFPPAECAPPGTPAADPETLRELRRLGVLVEGLLKLLQKQGIVNRKELAAAVEAVKRETSAA